MMDERLIDLNSEICLARLQEICGYFNPHKHWMRLFAMNRRHHPAGGETFIPYRVDSDGIRYCLADVLAFISLHLPDMTPEKAKEVLQYHEGPKGVELQNLLRDLEGNGAIHGFESKDENFDDDTGAFDGCFLREEDFYDALEVIGEVEDGIKRTMDHLIALTKLCEGMAATRAKPDEPTAEYLSSFGWGAINDADKLLFKLQNLASLLDRNSDQYEDDMVELGEGLSKEAA